MFETIVIGKGLIGSAAGRYLSETGKNIAIIGPDEPTDWPTHSGVFASHYDQGRITRILDADWVWATLAKRSIEQYPFIEAQSGLKFHYARGGLQVDQRSDQKNGYIAQMERTGRHLGANFKTYTYDLLREAYPWFRLGQGSIGVSEDKPAGYIQPRDLIRAQLHIAKQQGALIIRERVVTVKTGSDGIEITCASGKMYQAKKILLAAGAYTNTLLEKRLDLTPVTRTILLAEIAEQDLGRYRDMPTLICEFSTESPIPSIYLLPPIQYSDGKYYLKIGGEGETTKEVLTPDALQAWFQSGGNPASAQALKEVLLELMPNLPAQSFKTKPCVTTHTPSDYPYIDIIEAGQIFVAAGGCGYAAKSSNEIGRLAAQLVERNAWADDLDAGLFKAKYAEGETTYDSNGI